MSDSADKKTILVVDDAPANIALILDALKPDYRTKVATSGEKALSLVFSDTPPDLILLDIVMPNLSGYDVCSRLKQDAKTRNIPIIFVTAMNEVEDEEKGLALGAVDYVTKPISPPIVRARVRTHLALSEQARQLEALVVKLEAQAAELAIWNSALEQRVDEGNERAKKLAHIAFHDPLTGLPNRALLLDRLEHAIAAAGRDHSTIGLMFIDLDKFKFVNDTLGHDVGDVLLKEVAHLLSTSVRPSDTVARLGGDEFVILLDAPCEPTEYAGLAERIIAVLSRPMTIMGHPVQIGASVGIACFPDDGANLQDLMKNADAAMYAAKTAGRGTYRFFQAAMTESAVRRQRMESELRDALERQELELAYQPRVSLNGPAPQAVEALVRWRHPFMGLIPASEFVPLAEETGLIAQLGHWVLDEACRQCREWRDQGLGRVRIAVNISARQAEDSGLPEVISQLTDKHGIEPADIEIELTESLLKDSPAGVLSLVARLGQIGVTVNVDDVGTGFSSLSDLCRQGIGCLKIDRSLVVSAEANAEHARVIKTIVALGQALQLEVIAEGVETEKEANLLRALGCTAVQGYYYAQPANAQVIGGWLQQDAGQN